MTAANDVPYVRLIYILAGSERLSFFPGLTDLSPLVRPREKLVRERGGGGGRSAQRASSSKDYKKASAKQTTCGDGVRV